MRDLGPSVRVAGTGSGHLPLLWFRQQIIAGNSEIARSTEPKKIAVAQDFAHIVRRYTQNDIETSGIISKINFMITLLP